MSYIDVYRFDDAYTMYQGCWAVETLETLYSQSSLSDHFPADT